MAKYSMKRNGKEVGPAEVYAEPHNMAGQKITVASVMKETSGSKYMNEMDISVGGISKNNGKPVKTEGMKIRGTGAATKGVMARGPMA